MEPVIKKVHEVEEEEVTMYGAKGVKIQWLISFKDGAENFAMRKFTMDVGGEIPEHSHWYEHEIYMLRGKCAITVNGNEYIVEKDNVLFIPPNARHSYKNIGDEPVEFLCIIPLRKPSKEGG